LALLEYSFTVVNANALNAALSSQRAAVRRHNQAMVRESDVVMARMRRGAPGATTDPVAVRARQADRQAAITARREQIARDKAVKDDSRRAQLSERARLREERMIQREQARHQNYWNRTQKASEDARIRATEARANIEARTLRSAGAIGRTRADKVMGVGGRVMGTVGTVGRMVAGGAMLAGGMAIGAGVMQRLENTKIAANLAAQAQAPGRAREVLGEAAKVRGFETGEVLAGLANWQTITGQLDTGLVQMQAWADLADNTSSSLGDLASAAGTMFVGLEAAIPDTDQRLKAVSETMRAMAAQGTAGSLELRDLSIQIGEMWASAKKFGSGADPVRQMRQMGAFAQVVKGAGGLTAPETLTTIQRMPDDIIQSQKKFREAGIKIWEPGKEGHQLRELTPLLGDIFEKTGGRVDKIMALGFDIRSKRGVEVFAEQYSKAEERQKGSGREAVTKRLAFFEDKTRTDQEIATGATGRRGAEDKQFMERMRELNRAVGEAALPQLNEMGEQLVKLVPTIAKTTGQFLSLVNWMISNPWMGLGAIVGASMVKEIAGAAIGAAVRNAIITTMTPQLATAGLTQLGTASSGAAAAVGGLNTSSASAAAGIGKLSLALAAIPAVMLAVDQATKLWKETGGGQTEAAQNREARATAVKEGRMTAAQAMAADIAEEKTGKPMAAFQPVGPDGMPIGPAPKHVTAIEEADRARRLAVYQTYERAAPQPGTQGPGTGYGIRASEEGGPIAAQKPSPGLSKEAAAEVGKIMAAAAVAEIQKGGIQLNRGNTPSAVKPS